MIGYFPSLYQDELLYSWFARYHEHTGNISPKRTLTDLFNTTKIIAVLDIPSNLNMVYGNLKHFNIPEVEFLIKDHTLFKYYTFFQSDEKREKVLNYMKSGGKPGSSHLLLGINTFLINGWKYIRYCPICSMEDIKKYGEPYWRVTHQLPKSFYCIEHHQLLIDSEIEVRNKHRHQYIPANLNVDVNKQNKSPYSTNTTQHLKVISVESNKLIELDYLDNALNMQEVYKYLLQINGYANYFGKINQEKLAEQFVRFYGDELFQILNLSVDKENPSCWLKSITRKHRKSFHPIQHILLLNFFEVSVERLKDIIGKKYNPFGEAPYYCLNPAADHYQERIIKQIIITNCTDTRKPVGTFKCTCGFIYSRRGPDSVIEDQFKVGRIKEFGFIWFQKLNRLINIEGRTYKEAAKELHCDSATVMKYAQQKLSDEVGDISNKIKVSITDLKEKEWKELISAHPTLTITSIRKLNPALYTWHQRNNKDFLESNKPNRKKKIIINNRVNWDERDEETLKQVIEALEVLYSKEKPVFVNKNSVKKYICNSSYIEKHLEKLPKTREYLINNIETRESFQVRRLYWSCKKLYENGELIKEWKVRRMAGFKKIMNNKIEMILENVEMWGNTL